MTKQANSRRRHIGARDAIAHHDGRGHSAGSRPHRFPAGRSGNPRGRRKGSRNLLTVFKEVAMKKIKVRLGGKVRKMTMAEYVFRMNYKAALEQRNQKAMGNILMLAQVAGHLVDQEDLKRMIAYRIQEEAFGGLDRKIVKLLERLANGETPREFDRRLKPGTVLIREYNGQRHTVTVVPEGFLWQDKTWSSLSTIAKAITGTNWNGPRFFGLRVSGATEIDPVPPEPVPPPNTKPPRRGRSSVRAGHSTNHGRGRKRG